MFNEKLLGTSNGNSAAAAAAVAGSGIADWCVEARSLEWQCFARAWNALITSLRHSDLLTNDESAEVAWAHIRIRPNARLPVLLAVAPPTVLSHALVTATTAWPNSEPIAYTSTQQRACSALPSRLPQLLFSWITGAECNEFFGVPEYVIFPPMITSPVFLATVWRNGKRVYSSFEKTLLQTRDLAVWLAMQMRLVPYDEEEGPEAAVQARRELMQSLTVLADLHAKYSNAGAAGVEHVLRLRSTFSKLVKQLLELHNTATSAEEQQEAAENVANLMHALMMRVKKLYMEGVSDPSGRGQGMRECAEAWRLLQALLQPELIIEYRAEALRNLQKKSMGVVLSSLDLSLNSTNPGGEPRNMEAQRQVLFFCNSLFNTTMVKPPPVFRMKSWSCFTPHYAEDVTYSVRALKGNTGDNVNLQSLLTS